MSICVKKYLGLVLCLLAMGCSLFGPYYGTYRGQSSITVEKGMTLYGISKWADVPIRTLIDANGMRSPYTLREGQTVRIPRARIHVVRKSETVYSISKRYGLSVSALSRQNNIKSPYTLSIGQKLVITGVRPASGKMDAVAGTSGSGTVSKASAASKVAWSRDVSVPSNRRFSWPVRGRIFVDFGPNGDGRQNDGINIAAAKGTIIKTADAGTVVYADNELKGYGNLVLLNHGNGWVTAYAHADKLTVKKGQAVKRGDMIATVGSTGNVATPQVHFEIRYKSKVVDPKRYLQ